jgi:hypothetical protein
MSVAVGHPFLALDGLEVADLLHPAGRLEVVEDRLVSREPLEPHHLLGQERAVLPKLDVALAGKTSELLIHGHAGSITTALQAPSRRGHVLAGRSSGLPPKSAYRRETRA